MAFAKNVTKKHRKVVDLSDYRIKDPDDKKAQPRITEKREFKHSLSVGTVTKFFDGEKLVLGRIVSLANADKTYDVIDGQGFLHLCSSDPAHVSAENKVFMKTVCSVDNKKRAGYLGVSVRV